MKLIFLDESDTKDVKFKGSQQSGAKRYFFVGMLSISPQCYRKIVRTWEDIRFITQLLNEIEDALFNVLKESEKVNDIRKDIINELRPILLRKEELKGSDIAKKIDKKLRDYNIPKDKIDISIETVYAIMVKRIFGLCDDIKLKVIYVDKSKVKAKGFEKSISKVESKTKEPHDFMEYIGLLISELSTMEKVLSNLVLEITFDRLKQEIEGDSPSVIIADNNFFKAKRLKDDVLQISDVLEVMETDSKDVLGISICDIAIAFVRNLILHPIVGKEVIDRLELEELFNAGRISVIDVTRRVTEMV